MNTSHLLIRLLICLVCLPVFLHGQGWERSYPINQRQAQAVLPTPDGGALVLVSPSSGSLASELQLIKTDANGFALWTQDVPTPGNDLANDMIATPDGGVAIVGITSTGPNGFTDASVLKYDAQYNLEWHKTFGLPDKYEGGRVLLADAAGYWLTGNWGEWPVSGFVARLDLQGNVVFSTTAGFNYFTVRDMVLLPGGGVKVLGYGNPLGPGNSSRILTNTYDAAGNLTGQTEWGTGNNSYSLLDAEPTPDGGLLLSGRIGFQSFLQKQDAQGNEEWQNVYPQVPSLYLLETKSKPDGSGYRLLIKNFTGNDAVGLMDIDLAGQTNWQKNYGGGAWTSTFHMTLLPDNSCLIAGSYNNAWFTGQDKPYVIKTDPDGNSFYSGVSGKVSFDSTNNCAPGAALAGNLIQIESSDDDVFWARSDANGNYYLPLDSGDYQLKLVEPNPAWVLCQTVIPTDVMQADTSNNLDFVLMFQPQALDSVYGYAFYDVDGDCFRDSFETTGFEGLTVNLYLYGGGAVNQTYTTTTDSSGYYVFDQLTDANNSMGANVIIEWPSDSSDLYCAFTGCAGEDVFTFDDGLSHQSDFGFQCDTLPECPIMEVDIATWQIRPCSTSYYVVTYRNIGAEPATPATVDVTIDPSLVVTTSSIPWTAVNGNVYTFDLGNLNPGQGGTFQINAVAPCSDPVGTTYCVEAHAYPDTCSLPPGPDWDGSQIVVTAVCDGDNVIFTIQNVGSGDMSQALDYVVAEDNVMLMMGQFQLASGQSQQVNLPADGSLFRLEADQAPGFPGLNLPIAFIQGCGGNGTNSLGFVNQYALGDQETWLDIFCLESVNSYDPNDKTGFPYGYGNQHFIEQNIDLEYLIRFQNTGTAPALNVEIRDPLAVQWLDPATVRPGASSHPYTWNIEGSGVLVFRFADINLPDSSSNPEASQGFVKFTVSQRPDVPLNTVIENTAGIYFDNNEAIQTNTSWHTIGKDFIESASSATGEAPGARVQVFIAPQPAGDVLRIRLEGLETTEGLNFYLLSPEGRLLLQRPVNATVFDQNLSGLPAGMYYYRIGRHGEMLSGGRMVKM